MKIINAARFAGFVFIATGLITLLGLGPGLDPRLDGGARADWFAANGGLWMVGGWLWLLAIFAWMVLLVSFLWSYSPAHRIATMLQSGLMLIAATLAIAGVLVWMNMLPAAVETGGDLLAFTDGLALTFFGAGLFMGGIVTAWLGMDMRLMDKLPNGWVLPGILAGLLLIPSPFLLPRITLHLWLALAVFIAWCAILAVQRKQPDAYPEWLGL
jgi:hypothetical protein